MYTVSSREILIPKPDKDNTREENYRQYLHEHRWRYPHPNISKLNPSEFKNN